MEVEEGEDVALNTIDKAFRILNEGPPSLAGRAVRRHQVHTQQWAAATHKLTLAAFPPVYPGEPEECRLQRSAAFEACWEQLSSQVKVGLPVRETNNSRRGNRLPLARPRSHPGRGDNNNNNGRPTDPHIP